MGVIIIAPIIYNTLEKVFHVKIVKQKGIWLISLILGVVIFSTVINPRLFPKDKVFIDKSSEQYTEILEKKEHEKIRSLILKNLKKTCRYDIHSGKGTERYGEWSFYVRGYHDVSKAVSDALRNAGLNYSFNINEWSGIENRTYINIYDPYN